MSQAAPTGTTARSTGFGNGQAIDQCDFEWLHLSCHKNLQGTDP